MAAGAYKSLTIKIGAETSGLTQALSAANTAAFKTQGQLRKLSQAAKIDPGNIDVASAQMGAFAEQAVNAAAKIESLSAGMKVLGDTPLVSNKNMNVAELVSGTKSLTLEAERARQAYANVDAELNKIYSDIKRNTAGAVNLRKSTNEGTFDEDLENAKKHNLITDEDAASIEKLKEKWGEARAALDDYSDAAKLGEMNTELAAQEAQLNKLYRDLADVDIFASFKDLGDTLAPINERMTLVSAAVDVAADKFGRLDSAVKLDPGTLESAQNHAVALGETLETVQMKADLLRTRMQAYETAGIDKLAKGMGNVSVEVEQAERAFHQAQRNLTEFRQTGDVTSAEFERLSAAADSAQKRMDTAHAVQQYRELQMQLAETDSKFASMAKQVADISMPSEVFRGMEQLREAAGYIGEALTKVKGDASSFDSALKINPDNVTVASEQMRLLEEAERLAREEAQLLKDQMAEYDVSAIEAARDSNKSAAQQVLETSQAYEEAAAKVREINVEISNTQDSIDKIRSKGTNLDLGDTLQLATLNNRMRELRSEAEGAGRAVQEAGRQFDLSKQAQELDDLQMKVAQNAATQDQLFVAMQKAQGVKIVPEVDFSAIDRLKQRFEELKVSSSATSGIGSVTEQIKGMDKDVEAAKNRVKELDELLKMDPGNEAFKAERAEALATAIDLARSRVEMLNGAYQNLSPDKIDEVALATGRTGEYASKAAAEAKTALSEVTEIQEKIKEKQKELGDLPEALGNTERGAAQIRGLQDEIKGLEQELEQAKQVADTALDGLDSAKGAKEASELEKSLGAANKALLEFERSAGTVAKTDVTPKFDKSWADAVEVTAKRFKTLDEAMKLNPMSLSAVIERAKALATAADATRDKIHELKTKLAEMRANGVDDAAKKMGNVAVETEKAHEAAEKAKEAVDKLQKQYDAAAQHASKLGSEMERTGKGKEKYEEAQRAVEKYRKELDDAKNAQKAADAAATTANTCSEYLEAEDALQRYENKLKGLGKGTFGDVSTAAVQAASQIGQYAERMGREIIDASNEVDAAYRNLRKTFDAEESDYQRLYDAAMKYSQTHVTSADTMLDMEAIAAQLGVGIDGGAEAIQKFSEAAANLDVATDIDAETIALQMGQIRNVMGDVGVDNIDKFGDALVRLGNNMPTQESNIMQITQRLSAIGDVAHFTTPELMGWAAAIASTGQKSEAAASGIATTITNISKAVSVGGEDLQKYADVAGMTAEEFAESWRSKPSETLQEFIGGLKKDGDELFATLMGLDINGVRQNQTLAALAQTVDMVSDSIQMADDAFNGIGDTWGEAGDAAREAEKKAEGFSGSYAKLQNSIQVLAASLGDALVPWIEKAAEYVQKFTSWLDGMGDGFKGVAVVVGGAATAISVLEPPIKALMTNFGNLAGGIIRAVVTEFTNLGIAVARTVGGFGSIGESLVVTGTKLGGVIEFATKAGAAFTGLAKAGNLFTGIFGTVAIVTAADYIRQFAESAIEAGRVDGILEDVRGTVSDLSADLWTGKDSASSYGESWKNVSADMADFLSSMEQHNRANKETRDTAVATIGELEHYRDVISEAAGKGSEFAGSELELKTAVEGLNDILGTNYKAADVLSGIYLDQSGAVQDLTGSIDQLIAAKEREIRLSAMEDIYKEDLKAHMEAENAYEKAAKARDEYMEKRRTELAGTVTYENENEEVLSQADIDALIRGEEAYRDLDQAADECRQVLGETGDALEVTQKQWEGYANEAKFFQRSQLGVREGIILTNDEVTEAIGKYTSWGDTLAEMQPEVKNLSKGLQEAKVGATEFAELAQNSPDLFAEMVEQSGGRIDKLIEKIKEWNMAELEDKYGKFDVDEQAFIDAEGRRTEWNGGEWVTQTLDVDPRYKDTISQASDELRQAMADAGVSAGEIMMGLDSAGVDLSAFASLTKDQFNSIYEAANGDMQGIVEAIASINDVSMEGVSVGFTFDAEGNLVNAQGEVMQLVDGEWQVKVGADTAEATEGIQAAKSEADGATAEMTVTVDDEEARAASESLDEDLGTTVTKKVETEVVAPETGSTSVEGGEVTLTVAADTAALDDLSGKISELTSAPHEVQVGVSADAGAIDGLIESLGSIQEQAGSAGSISISVQADATSVSAIAESLRDAVPESMSTSIEVTGNGPEVAAETTEALAGIPDSISTTISVETEGEEQIERFSDVVRAAQQNVTVSVTAVVSGQELITQLGNRIGSLPKTVSPSISVRTGNLVTATKQINDVNKASGAMKSVSKSYAATGNAATSTTPASNIKSLNSAVGGMYSKSISANAGGSATDSRTANAIWNVVNAINSLSSKTVTVHTNYTQSGKPGGSASGAYIPYDKIPRHAAGIFTQPTLTNIGWVGEDGAELYSGNSLVPLTNRKYSMPYINDISDAVAKKIGPVGGGDNIVINITGVSGPEETARAITRQLTLMGMAQGRR